MKSLTVGLVVLGVIVLYLALIMLVGKVAGAGTVGLHGVGSVEVEQVPFSSVSKLPDTGGVK